MFVRGGGGTANGNTPDIGPWSGHVTQKTERLGMQMYTATLESHEQIATCQKTTLTGHGKESEPPPLRDQNARNIFIFCCYSRLAHVDVKSLKKSNVVIGMDGNPRLSLCRERSHVPVKIPLLPKALSIMELYDTYHEELLLPVCSNQKINKDLKQIAKKCGIGVKVTYHIARHTFATTMTLSNGVPIETVSKMLGHTKLSTTQVYARVLEDK